ncbi:hypothetical protein BD769DRAFT_973 [Suillus cothurnatus]|nr:hypothetical protein BD769DRAFT_973 [Suillus cothurnatus]
MRASATYLVVLSMATTLVSSHSSASHLTQALSGPLYKRQGPTPSQCTPSCDPVQSEMNDGCPIAICCTQSFETSYYNCLLCVGTAENTTDYTTSQADLDNIYVSCYNSGYPLQELTLPGQNPSRTLPTTSSDITSTTTDTSSASVSASTSVTSVSSSISQTTILPSSSSSTSSGTSTSASDTTTSTITITPTTALPSSTSSASSGTSTTTNGTATSPTSISQTSLLPSSASSESFGTFTDTGTATSPMSVPTTSTSSAALELSIGGSGVWAFVAAAMGLTLLRNN